MKWFKFVVLSLLGLFIGMAVLVETSFGRRVIQTLLVKGFERSGVLLEVGQISGDFPQQIHVTQLRIEGIAAFENVEIKISILPLLLGQLRINELRAERVHVLPASQKCGKKPFSFPMALLIRHYQFEHIEAENLPEFAVEGKASLRARGKAVYLQGTLHRADVPEAALEFEVAKNRLGKWETDATLVSPTLAALQPWLPLDKIEGAVKIHTHLRGAPDAFTGTIDGKFEESARSWAFKSRVRKPKNNPIQFQRLIASTKGLRVSGDLNLDASNHFHDAKLQLRAELGAWDLPAEGTVFAKGTLENAAEGIHANLSWTSDQIHPSSSSLGGLFYSAHDKPESIEHMTGTCEGTIQKESFQGTCQAKANFLKTAWNADTSFMLRYGSETSITLDPFHVSSDLLSMDGNVTFIDPLWIGNVNVLYANLSLFYPNLTGIGRGTLTLQTQDGKQQIQTDIYAHSLTYGPISAESAHATTSGPAIHAELEHVKWKKIVLDTAVFDSVGEPFSLDVDGKLLQFHAEGQWDLDGSGTIQILEGRGLQHRLRLLKPVSLTWGHNRFSVDPTNLAYGPGTIEGEFQWNQDAIDANVTAQKIPLDIISFDPMMSRAEGTFDTAFTLHKKGDKTDADWNWTLPQGILENPTELLLYDDPPPPLTLAAKVEGKIHNDSMHLQANMQVRNKPYLDLNLTTPFHLDADWNPSFPPRFILGSPSGTLKADGRMEDLLDFLDLGMHRLSGNVHCDLSLSRGRVKGTCTLEEGYYQNYVTGTELQDIGALLEGSGDYLVLKSLNSKDLREGGHLFAKGFIQASLQDALPFHIDVTLDRLDIVQIDLVTATANGNLSIEGNLHSALASGLVQITRSDVTIPTHIPRSYPDLQVVYKHRPVTAPVQTPTKLPYPLNLDLKIEAPKAVFIEGRGITSEWNGDFTIGGTYAEPAIQGHIGLIDGEFSFAGKRFKLTNGSLSMQGNQYKLPLIDITATTTEKAVTIMARLKGPINRPQLTFQSVPPLPLSAILSHLLFGKDLSDVTGLQALQLAGTVAAVAGEGPDILEITRKSLGVDRLQIVMTPTKSGDGYDGKETISLQVGKVITPGVILTVKQSADDSNPDIAVEVDLTHGFVLEVENQQQPEQGKFSLKWNVNY